MVRIYLAQTEADKSDIFRFRYNIFKRELNKNLEGTNNNIRELRQNPDSRADLFMMKNNNRLIGSIRFMTLKDYRFDQFYGINLSNLLRDYSSSEISNTSLLCLDPEFRSRGKTELFAPVIYRHARQKGVKINIAIAPKRCLHYYSKYGYSPIGDCIFSPECDEEVCPIMVDFQKSWYLQEIRSPFVSRRSTEKSHRIEKNLEKVLV